MNVLRGVLRRAPLIIFGLVLALLAAEALLQGGAWYLRRRGEPAAMQWSTGSRRVICVGDSNTYGLYLQRPQAYPAQLEQRWGMHPEWRPLEVLNLGVPGTNSSKLRNRFNEILHGFAPDVVLIMIGANDAWTVPVPLEDGGLTAAQWLWSHSRVFRLLYMVRRAVLNRRPEVSVEFVPPGQPKPKGALRIGDQEIDLSYTEHADGSADWPLALRANLVAMVERTRALGAQPVLLTYPATYLMYASANEVIRTTARETQTPLIDVAAAMRAACPQGGCPELFLPDHHATARGNTVVAETVVKGLAAAFDGAP